MDSFCFYCLPSSPYTILRFMLVFIFSLMGMHVVVEKI